jgi:hypothetical protein
MLWCLAGDASTFAFCCHVPGAAGRFSKPYGLVVAAAFGGLSKSQQFKEMKGGCEVGCMLERSAAIH